MIETNEASSTREVAIADHLWATLETMSREMATPVDVLLGQAIFTFARFNGYLGSLRQGAERGGGAEVTGAPSAATVFETAGPRSAAAAPVAAEAPPPVPRSISSVPAGPPPVIRPAEQRREAAAAGLVLRDDNGASFVVEGERFVIGRGKHCNLVIDSTRISREHAAIVREGGGWFIEDLGSSNGTWFDKQRIDRRRIADGDEFFVCSERLRCLVR
ncbi:FHA domain-containing protein [Vulgatibacter sp.]|uniref:FHA domain-containing protein n=1 Tax=Vulgatibacter sp. TaxID=1971226 RepID=UPI0035626769